MLPNRLLKGATAMWLRIVFCLAFCLITDRQTARAIDVVDSLLGKFTGAADTNRCLLQSIEGRTVSVTVSPDVDNGVLRLAVDSGNEVCFGPDVFLADSLRILNRTFLKICLHVRGGSGVTVRRSVLVCVSNGKAVVAADITSEVTSVFSGIWDEIADSSVFADAPDAETYYVSLSVIEDSSNFKLRAVELHLIKPTFDSVQYFETKDTTEFTFDETTCAFVNAFDSLIGEFRIVADDDDHKRFTAFQGKKFPTMKFKSGNTYFKMDDRWYERGRDNFLIQQSYSCEDSEFDQPTGRDSL